MYCQKASAEHFSLAGGTTGFLYPPAPDGSHSIAAIVMNGGYPERGTAFNDRCTETLYMLSGTFHVACAGAEYVLRAGDVLVIAPGKRYRSWGSGEALVLITPSWDRAQHHIIDTPP
ncbi:MAG: hypothetical protein Q8R13_00380 [bacterium]|nr:hypothetical protein [bacterium]MDZ4295853.1 hypothetical protein [Patescibacteria group bacterium]MDZ4295860.1 hypothetical protein [Patescibacteria group bacterium]